MGLEQDRNTDEKEKAMLLLRETKGRGWKMESRDKALRTEPGCTLFYRGKGNENKLISHLVPKGFPVRIP